MPKFLVTASEVTFYRSTVEADSADHIRNMFDEDDVERELELEEYDGEALSIVSIEEIP